MESYIAHAKTLFYGSTDTCICHFVYYTTDQYGHNYYYNIADHHRDVQGPAMNLDLVVQLKATKVSLS